jgi:hypothetical protein
VLSFASEPEVTNPRMKINAYLENSRMAICDAIKLCNLFFGSEIDIPLRRELIFALTELDAFRHGHLQNCDKCGNTENVEGP